VNFLKDLTPLSTFLILGEPKDGQNGRCLALGEKPVASWLLIYYLPKDQLFADDGRKGLLLLLLYRMLPDITSNTWAKKHFL
jgi:hypothetical protein